MRREMTPGSSSCGEVRHRVHVLGQRRDGRAPGRGGDVLAVDPGLEGPGRQRVRQGERPAQGHRRGAGRRMPHERAAHRVGLRAPGPPGLLGGPPRSKRSTAAVRAASFWPGSTGGWTGSPSPAATSPSMAARCASRSRTVSSSYAAIRCQSSGARSDSSRSSAATWAAYGAAYAGVGGRRPSPARRGRAQPCERPGRRPEVRATEVGGGLPQLACLPRTGGARAQVDLDELLLRGGTGVQRPRPDELDDRLVALRVGHVSSPS